MGIGANRIHRDSATTRYNSRLNPSEAAFEVLSQAGFQICLNRHHHLLQKALPHQRQPRRDRLLTS